MGANDIESRLILIDEMSNEIKAIRSNVESNLKRVTEQAKQAQGAFGNLGNEIKGNFVNAVKSGVIAYLGFQGIQKITGFMVEARKEANQWRGAQMQLASALGYSSQILREQAQVLEEKFLIDDAEIAQAQVRLAAYIRDEKAIERLIPAIMKLSAAKGISLVAAAEQVARGIADDSDELGRYRIQVTGARESVERIDSVLNGLNSTFRGQDVAARQAKDGIDVLATSWGNFLQSIGEAFKKKDQLDLLSAQKELYENSLLMRGEYDERTLRLKQLYNDAQKKLDDQRAEAERSLPMGPSIDPAIIKQREENAKKDEEITKKQSADYIESVTIERNFNETMKQIRAERMAAEQSWSPVDDVDYNLQIQQDVADQERKIAWDNYQFELQMQENKAKLREQDRVDSEQHAETLTAIYASMATSMGAAIAGAMEDGQINMQKMFRAILVTWLSFIQRQMVASIFANAAKKFATAGIPGLLIAGVEGAALTAAFEIAKAKIGGFESGTRYAPGGMSMVGERGPEMMYVPRGAQIYNNSETRHMETINSGSSITLNVLGSNGAVVRSLEGALRSGDARRLSREIVRMGRGG